MFCTPPTPFDLLPHKPEDPFGLSQTLKRKCWTLTGIFAFVQTFRVIFMNVNTKEENRENSILDGCLKERKSNFPQDIVSVVHRVLLLHLALSTSILLSYCVENTWCLKQMYQGPLILYCVDQCCLQNTYRKYIKIVEIEEMSVFS